MTTAVATTLAVETTPTDPSVLRDLRRHRRRNRLADLDWFDALYHAYLTGLLGIVIVLFLSSFVGDDRLTASELARVVADGPALLGVLPAVAVALGLRSGSRGGPLALEAAEVRYVLLAPVERSAVLRPLAVKMLRFAGFVGAALGAVAGELASNRLPDGAPRWILAGAVLGALTAIAGVAAALLGSGLHCPRWAATILAGAAVAWSVGGASGDVWSPFARIGGLAVWPLDVRPGDLVAVAVVLVAVIGGLLVVGSTSLEAAERRTGLVAQLRFAVTVRDLRTVVLLRRQLAFDLTRDRPWLRIPPGRRLPVLRRGMRSLLRFPAPRLARITIVCIGAGLAARGVWDGTTPLVVVVGAALYAVGLDVTEPLAQEIDQPDRADSYPVERTVLHLRHLAAPAVAVVPCMVIGAAAGVAAEPSSGAVAVAAVAMVPIALAGLAGAVVSVVLPPPDPFKDGQLLPPEFGGMRVVLRTLWPLVMATAGTLPLVAAREAALDGYHPVPTLAATSALVGILVAMTMAWVRFREAARLWWDQQLEAGQLRPKPTGATRS